MLLKSEEKSVSGTDCVILDKMPCQILETLKLLLLIKKVLLSGCTIELGYWEQHMMLLFDGLSSNKKVTSYMLKCKMIKMNTFKNILNQRKGKK